MKPAALLLLALTLSALAYDPKIAAENKGRPNAFAGVPWGTRPEETIRTLGERSGVTVPEELPSGARIELTGGTFSEQNAEKWILEFNDRKLFAATVVFKNDVNATARFRELKQMLAGKYGPPMRDGGPPLAIGADKKDRRAQQRANPEQKLFGNLTSWKFPTTLQDRELKTIDLSLTSPGGTLTTDENALVVSIRYVNESLRAASSPDDKAGPPGRPAKPRDL